MFKGQWAFIVLLLLILTGCQTTKHPEIRAPQEWQHGNANAATPKTLKNWWHSFKDPTLNKLVALTLESSPDQAIAAARIEEARGLRRTTRGNLFPRIDGTGQAGRQKNIFFGVGDSYDIGFDASFELDIFGRNRLTDQAAQLQIQALQAQYHDVVLSLIAEVARVYTEYQAADQQLKIAEKNLALQEKTLELINNLKTYGEASRLDVERASNVVETTRAAIPLSKQQKTAAWLQLSVLTGQMPEVLANVATETPANTVTDIAIKDILLTPATVLNLRPDVQAASYALATNSALTRSTIAQLFPSFNLAGFYGLTSNATISNATNIWSILLNVSAPILNFGRIEGQIDAAKAREVQAFQQYRKTILAAIAEVETGLNDYAQFAQRQAALEKASVSASEAFKQSKILYKEGEIDFLSVLDAQRTLNSADSAVITAQASRQLSLIRLYKSLGVY